MGKLIVDAATSLYSLRADTRGRTVTPDLDDAGLADRLTGACGAMVMSAHTLDLLGGADWIVRACPAGTPVLVVVPGAEPAHPLAESALRTVADYPTAFRAARAAAGDREVLVVGQAGAVRAAVRGGEADEIWLRLVAPTFGRARAVIEEDIPVEDYFVSEMESTDEAVHMHLERRRAGKPGSGGAGRQTFPPVK